jgi:glycosyltransferase involved in cell wall biosynthesis
MNPLPTLECAPTTAFAHPASQALALLRRWKSDARSGEIHLDVGCGAIGLADAIAAEFGRIYVGIDLFGGNAIRLANRGLEGHDCQIVDGASLSRALDGIIADRPVGAITFLDIIDRLLQPEDVLEKIATIGRAHVANVVVSARNISHRDIGAKLLFGRWDSTQDGLLGRDMIRPYDQRGLRATLEKAGLPVVDCENIVEPISDQAFPSTHPALAAGATLSCFLSDLARQVNPAAEISRFVWLCAPSKKADRETFAAVREEARPLVSVITRTQGRRAHTLMELLTCLFGQTDQDFEILIVGHNLDQEGTKAIEGVIADTPESLRRKTRLICAVGGGRSRPLNVGFAAARGLYIAILDDDDIPLGNWIAEYRALHLVAPGRVLRATSARQNVETIAVNKRAAVRAEGSPEPAYPATYDFLRHFLGNVSPNNTLAFPRGAFHDLSFRFDETLSTTEDWDFLLRAASYCGVLSSPEITGIYRWWGGQQSSRTAHTDREWTDNHDTVLKKQNQYYCILPKGALAEIRKVLTEADSENRRISEAFSKAADISIPSSSKAADSSIPSAVRRLGSIEDAEQWGQWLRDRLPRDLARALQKRIRLKRFGLKLKYLTSPFSKTKRRCYKEQINIYGRFLSAIR